MQSTLSIPVHIGRQNVKQFERNAKNLLPPSILAHVTHAVHDTKEKNAAAAIRTAEVVHGFE